MEPDRGHPGGKFNTAVVCCENAPRWNHLTKPQAFADCEQRTQWNPTRDNLNITRQQCYHSGCPCSYWFWIRDCYRDTDAQSQSDMLRTGCDACCQVDSLVCWKGNKKGQNNPPFLFHQVVVVHPLPCSLEMFLPVLCIFALLICSCLSISDMRKTKKDCTWLK